MKTLRGCGAVCVVASARVHLGRIEFSPVEANSQQFQERKGRNTLEVYMNVLFHEGNGKRIAPAGHGYGKVCASVEKCGSRRRLSTGRVDF